MGVFEAGEEFAKFLPMISGLVFGYWFFFRRKKNQKSNKEIRS